MLNKKILIVFLIFSGFLVFSSLVQATIISQVYFTDFNMEKASFNAGEEIRGNFVLWNYEKQVVPDITYSYKLLAQDSSGFYTIVLDEKFSGDNFSLKPGQKVTKSFSYRLPQNLPSGSHRFRVQLFNSKGLPMSRKDSDVTIQSDDKFLTLENHFLLKDGEKFSPMGTVVYDAGQLPKIIFDILNSSSFQISASPRIAFYYYNITENPLRVINQQSITLKPGKSQNRTFDLIDFREPGNYVCRLVMYHNNEVISNSIDFRWKISGKEAAIAQVKLDDTSYREGDEAEVTTDVVFKEEGGELQVTIYDEEGRIVGEKKEGIDSKGGRTDIKVPITGDVVNPRVEIMAFDEYQKALDKYEAQVKDDEITEEEVPEKDRGAYLMIGILILILIFMIYFWRKGSSVTKAVFIVALVFSGIFLSGNSVLAAEAISFGPNNDIFLSWDNPLPEYLYEEGSYVPYKGHLLKFMDPDPFRNNNFEFFIAEINGIATTTDLFYNIEVIDIDNSEAEKIGELSLLATSTPVEYDKPIRLPSGLPDNYLGEAWFCMQFRGENVNTGDWYWYIACQEVIVQPEGEGCLYLNLDPADTEVGLRDEVNLKVKVDNKCPCIAFDLDVIPIIDISGSMRLGSPTRISQAKSSAKEFVEIMRHGMESGDHQLGLTSYSNDGYLDHFMSFNPDSIKDAIDDLSLVNMTCISCGIKISNKLMNDDGRPLAVPYHVLMTDGQANYCIDYDAGDTIIGKGCSILAARAETLVQAGESASAGIKIYTIGFSIAEGSDAEQLMKDVAATTSGQYFHAPTGEELEAAYKTIAGELLGQSPGTVLKIDIDPNYFTLIDIDPRCSYDGTTLTCNMGDLDCGGTDIDDFEFIIELIDGDAGDEIEIEVTVENAAGKEKKDTSTVTVTAPAPPSGLGVNWGHCDVQGLSRPTFYWDAADPSSDHYQIKIYGSPDEDDAGGTGMSYVPLDSYIRDNLSWNQNYDWEVRVGDGSDSWSAWAGDSFAMPTYHFPWVNFEWSPEKPSQGERVTFDPYDHPEFHPVLNPPSVLGSGAAEDEASYLWEIISPLGISYNFVDGTDEYSIRPRIVFDGRDPDFKVKLTIQDRDPSPPDGFIPYQCPREKDIIVTMPLPEYRPVAPIGRLDNFLARIADIFR